MGTTLTGTTPQDTYDSLIKVTDNGPLTGSLKKLTDGLGNDSSLSLSTTAASLSGTLAVTGATTLTGALGGSTATFSGLVSLGGASATNPLSIRTKDGESYIRFLNADGTTYGDFERSITGSGAVRFTGAFFRIVNTLETQAIKFPVTQVASADANVLDDYEEGTWTMGVAFGGNAVGVTTSRNTGTYTKIGRQVTVNGYLTLTSKGSSTGQAKITGLPFTIANNDANYSAPSLRYENITFANQFQGFGAKNTTTIELNEITILGVVTNITDADFANNSNIMVSFTYFV